MIRYLYTPNYLGGESEMEENTLVKRMLGNEWNARGGKVFVWVKDSLKFLPENLWGPFTEVVLMERDGHEVAKEMGLTWATLRGRVADAFQMLGVLARSLSKGRSVPIHSHCEGRYQKDRNGHAGRRQGTREDALPESA